jgi:hydroxyacylglutathione hydrolase
MYFKQFFDEKLAQYAYLVGCQKTGEAIVIDPMRDIDQYITAAAKENLSITKAVDTHIHADYISGLREFAERGVHVYGSDEGDADWKYEWLIGSKYNHTLLKDGDEIKIGNIKIKAWHTPGHTPEHLSYFVTDGAAADEPMGVATGDFIFVGDLGRPDLLESAAGQEGIMEPSARLLYKTVEASKNLPDYLQIWPGHGAGSACGKSLGAVPETTLGYERRFNASLKAASSEENFVKFILEGQPEPPLYFARMKRDNKLGPKVLEHGIPQPKHLSQDELKNLAGNTDVVVLDTRTKEAFVSGHLPGSMLSTMNKQFNTVAGSYIMEDDKIYLIAEEHQVHEAVIDLIRIGLDNIVGYATPEDLEHYKEHGGELDTIEVVKWDDVDGLVAQGYQVFDVRKGSEVEELGHAEGAQNIAHTRLYARQNEIAGGKKYVVHCMTGGRASVASAYMKRLGHDVVTVFDDFANFKQAVTV